MNRIMQTDILQNIIAYKRKEIRLQEEAVTRLQLEALIETPVACRSMKQALAASATGIIAEFKRRSPSKDWIKQDADASLIPASYEKAGATALSILTDELFFGGSLKDIRTARPQVTLPILRKDFVISPYQLYQAKTVGADAILLIAAVLTPEECRNLAHLAHELKMEVLLELHSETELNHINDYIDMVGINNRNLGTFHTDVANSFHLAKYLPHDKVRISESGIVRPETIQQLREAGFQGFLMGETFMRTPNPAETLSHLIQTLSV